MLDQHFMIDKELLQRIVEAADIKKTDTILEIGPGTGNLTELLLEKAKHVYCIEKDTALVKQLQEKFKGKNITIICDDAIKVKFPEYNKCVSNLPYTICEPLLWKCTRIKYDCLVFVVPRKFTVFFTKILIAGLRRCNSGPLPDIRQNPADSAMPLRLLMPKD